MSFLSQVGEVFEEIGDTITGHDSDAERASEAAQNAGNDQRDAIYASTRDAMAQIGSATMLPRVVQPEAFDAYTHEEIFLHVQNLQPGEVLASAHMWRGAHEQLSSVVDGLWAQIDPILNTEWTGSAADGAKAAVRQYAHESHRLVEILNVVANKLEESYTGFEQTKLQVPPPQSFTFTDYARMMTGFPIATPGNIAAAWLESEAVRHQAVQVMNTVYSPVVVQSDTGVPQLPPPFDPTGNGPGAIPSSTLPSGGGYAPTGFASPNPVSGQFAGGSTDVAPAHPADTSAASTNAPAQAAPQQPTASPATGTPAATTGSAVPSTTSTAPADTHAASWAPSGTRSSGSGAGAAAGGGSGGGGGSLRTPFGSGAQTAGSNSGVMQNPGGRMDGSGSTRGMYGAGGMMPGGGRSGGDHDGEHNTPGYLVNVDNGDELVGDLPLVAPPVIG
ncbi:WXG100 family type VII secretion target [Actinomycetes bacterium M1A6_2h]